MEEFKENYGHRNELGFELMGHRPMKNKNSTSYLGSSSHSRQGLFWRGSSGAITDNPESQHVSVGTTGSLRSGEEVLPPWCSELSFFKCTIGSTVNILQNWGLYRPRDSPAGMIINDVSPLRPCHQDKAVLLPYRQWLP